MIVRETVSVQADVSKANLKLRSGRRSHDYVPGEAGHAIDQAHK
jgi:hypothetical protein